jgi:hypothetical protein
VFGLLAVGNDRQNCRLPQICDGAGESFEVRKMKFVLAFSLVAAAFAGSATSAFCEERIQAAAAGERMEAIDCSKQVWPHFSPTCLRNVDQPAPVRIITADRR